AMEKLTANTTKLPLELSPKSGRHGADCRAIRVSRDSNSSIKWESISYIDYTNLSAVHFQQYIKRKIEKLDNLSPSKSCENMNLMLHRYAPFPLFLQIS